MGVSLKMTKKPGVDRCQPSTPGLVFSQVAFGLFAMLQCCMGSGQPGHRDPEGRAANIIEPGQVAELDGAGVAAVFAADADL
jgi:hypothetical protein